MTHPSRSPVAVYTVTLLVLVATAGAMLAGVGGVAAAQDASLTCVGSGGGPPYQTDSGLTVFENDTDAGFGTFYFPDNETVRFDFPTDGVNLSAAGGADARLENGTGPTTCLGDVDASQHDITVAPDGESGLTVAGEYAGLSFREPNFSDSADGEVDLAYEATSPTAVTVTDTGLAADETVIAVDTSDGSELDSGTVGSDGSVTFDGLPTGSHAVDLRVQEPANYSVTITDTNGPVAADEDVVVEATIENVGEAQGNQKVRFGVDGTSQPPRTVSLNGSETTTETFRYVTSSSDTPAITASVASQNDTATAEIEVNEGPAPASFDVSNLGAPSSATQGDTAQVSATIENTGDKKATQTVTFSFDGNVTDSRDVTLAGGARQQVNFSLDTTGVAPGTYPYGVSTEDDSETGQITVEEASEQSMLRIEGTGDHAFYSFRATSEITSTRGLTGEDTVSGQSAAGAVAGGTDAYTFEGDLRNLYVGDDVRVFLNGERIDPDSYESVVSLAGDGNYTSYAFVTTGEITGMRGLTGEDTTNGSRAAGAVRGGTDSYTLTGTFAGLDTDGGATVILNGQPVRPSQFPNTLRIEGTGDRAFYSLRATGTVDGSGLTGEDTVSGATASGAVGGGADTYTFGGDLRNLYVQEGASVFLNGEQIDPDSYESVVSFAGDGDRTDYTFAVKNGRITGTRGLTGEDTTNESRAAGAVGGGTDSYTLTGTFAGLDTDGDATVVLNGQPVAPDPFDNTLTFEGTGSRTSYDFSVTGAVRVGDRLTREDSIDGDRAAGAVGSGSDTYIYSDTLEVLDTAGNVVVIRNGGKVSQL